LQLEIELHELQQTDLEGLFSLEEQQQVLYDFLEEGMVVYCEFAIDVRRLLLLHSYINENNCKQTQTPSASAWQLEGSKLLGPLQGHSFPLLVDGSDFLLLLYAKAPLF
jgi:hypothetical protein